MLTCAAVIKVSNTNNNWFHIIFIWDILKFYKFVFSLQLNFMIESLIGGKLKRAALKEIFLLHTTASISFKATCPIIQRCTTACQNQALMRTRVVCPNRSCSSLHPTPNLVWDPSRCNHHQRFSNRCNNLATCTVATPIQQLWYSKPSPNRLWFKVLEHGALVSVPALTIAVTVSL